MKNVLDITVDEMIKMLEDGTITIEELEEIKRQQANAIFELSLDEQGFWDGTDEYVVYI